MKKIAIFGQYLASKQKYRYCDKKLAALSREGSGRKGNLNVATEPAVPISIISLVFCSNYGFILLSFRDKTTERTMDRPMSASNLAIKAGQHNTVSNNTAVILHRYNTVHHSSHAGCFNYGNVDCGRWGTSAILPARFLSVLIAVAKR